MEEEVGEQARAATHEQQAKCKTYEIRACSISYYKPTTALPDLPVLRPPCTAAAPPAYILRDVSFTASPGELLAVVGPSGAGKSTLLDILASHTSPTRGAVLLNSTPLDPAAFRRIAVHVPQHDTALPQLTVAETFTFAARLLHPAHSSSSLAALVASLLADLRLTHLAHTRLGKGPSGGERRRISIGLSLLHDPAVLLLDEPTSGLDSSSALNVVQTLKSIAAGRRRTIVLSIHQPSFRILAAIDKILLLSKGTVVHHGSLPSLQSFLHSKNFQVPQQLNALEHAMEVLPQLDLQTPPPAKPSPPSSPQTEHDPVEIRYRSSRVHEVFTLYNRFWKIIYRTRQLLLTNGLEALLVGFFLGTIYINVGLDKQGMDKRLGLFAFTLTFLLSSTTETLPIFVSERPILLRESSSGVYRLSSHLIANTLVFLPYLLALAITYSFCVYFLVGLCNSWQAFAYFVLVIWVILLMANSFVLFLSSIAPNYIAGTSLVTVFLACFFLFSGYFISKDSMPKYWLFMHYFSLYKYALDSLLINEYSCQSSRCFVWLEGNKACGMHGRDVLEKRGLHEGQRWTNVQIMLGFFVFYRLLCWVVLTKRASRSKK